MAHAALHRAATILPLEEKMRTSTYANAIPHRVLTHADTS
jgi:hypothetical protein